MMTEQFKYCINAIIILDTLCRKNTKKKLLYDVLEYAFYICIFTIQGTSTFRIKISLMEEKIAYVMF